ncbi:MAG: MFS transporter [Lachnospiraceae bacterium]|jgi:NNP family nitrate/nitrite transporter-like MFS transporter|nr:MFS transporter [Lachnospiraceae bacterium]MCI1656520.1 MFS transporter [Lachnospiraceae bacterium]MCI2195002.1 MFS transporter [Lachnospiraceae bacterium]
MGAQNSSKGYRWVILILFVFGTMVLNFGSLIFASRPMDVEKMYGITQAQLTAVATVSQLPGALFSVVLGNYMDRKGVRKVTAVMLALAAVCMIWRAFAGNFILLFILTFAAGALYLPINVGAPKSIGAWFLPEQMGTAIGIYGAAAGVGTTLAFGIGNLFRSTRNAFIFIAVLYVVMFVLWLILGRENPVPEGMEGKEAPRAPKGAFRKVARSRNMWMVLICGGLAVGAALLLNTYLVAAFIGKGLSPSASSLVATLLNISLVIGGVLSGMLVSKVGRFNIPYFFICILGGALYFIAYLAPIGPQTFVLVILGGLIVSGSIGVNMARIPLLPLTGDFGPECVGTASGMNNTSVGVCAFVLPTIVATCLQNNYTGIFLIFLIFMIICAVVGGILLPELGVRGKLAGQASGAEENAEGR